MARTRTLAAVALSVAGAALSIASCAQEPVEAEVRSLERSGRVAFVCLGAHGAEPWRPITDCRSTAAETPNDLSVPHLYALVTQTTRGEVAVVDLTAQTDSVLDQDDFVPGSNFLPIGAQPIDIVSTPGGTAAFVGVAEIGRQGIFALPSSDFRTLGPDRGGVRVRGIRPVTGVEANTLSDWPACALPSAPGSMMVVADPPDALGEVRPRCDEAYESIAIVPPTPAGFLASEGQGRLKLVVALPDEGGLAVIDAQDVLDRAPGSFGACEIERWIPLNVDWEPGVPPPPQQGPACVLPPDPVAPQVTDLTSRPGGLAFAAGRLYAADLDAPVVHVIDMESPCSVVQRPSLQPRSAVEPDRVVTTTRVAVSPGLTPEGKRYLYAIDAGDGSVMVFDVSDASPTATPLERERPEITPFSPRDRIKFASAARDVVILERDKPKEHPLTGVAPTGVRCDPDPSLKECTEVADCDVETAYRTSETYDSGAGPFSLRGTFAFLVLSSGQVTVIDIDDYDARCRGPKVPDPLFGCPDGPALAQEIATSGEVSCNVVVPHSPRDRVYFVTHEDVGPNQPGVQLFPLLYDEKGSPLATNAVDVPRMVALLPEDPLPGNVPFSVAVGGDVVAIDQATGAVLGDDGIPKHTLVMNLEDPRAHVADQAWTVTFEGALPGFTTKVAELRIGTEFSVEDGSRGLFDAASRFCDAGVQSQQAVAEQLMVDLDHDSAVALADRVQIIAAITDESSSYWDSPATTCSFVECTAKFGTAALPTGGNRDLRVVEAFQDHLVLAPHDKEGIADPDQRIDDGLIKCCFPGVVTFHVRAGRQWVVVGDASGFFHHVIPDPATGACRTSCDPAADRLVARVRHSSAPPENEGITEAHPNKFRNPMFRFAIAGGKPNRNYQFRFVTQGAFPTLLVDLTGDAGEVQPQAITLVPGREDLAITDGSLEGLILVSPDAVDVTGRFF